jgi:purine nucleosidase
MQNFTVITDPGVDDIVALILLSRLAPKARNTLVSTFGNAPLKFTLENTREFIALIAPSWKLKAGSSAPLRGKMEHPFPDYFHGPDGVWKVHTNIDTTKVAEDADFPKNTSLLSLGPFTDVLSTIKANKPLSMTIMGGAFNEPGNETEFAEFNFALDAEAAHQFFANCHGIQPMVVPLDVTRKVSWTKDMVQDIPEKDPGIAWMKQILLAWFENYNHEKEKDFNLHDPLSVYLSFYPENAVWEESGVEIVLEGEQRGRSIFNNINPLCRIALDLRNPAEISKKIYNTIIA